MSANIPVGEGGVWAQTADFRWQYIRFATEAEAREYVALVRPGLTPQGSGRFALQCVLGPVTSRISLWTLHGSREECRAQIETTRREFGA